MDSISLQHARNIILNRQLLASKPKPKSKKNLLEIIEQLGYVQIDTISIVERAHHHILWTRMPGYERKMLDELLEKDKKIFEYWSHAAAFLPMRDYRFTFFRRDRYRKHYEAWAKENKKTVKFVLDRITSEGPMQSKDFEHTGKVKAAGWWDWKPAKYALQHLFHDGTLMIASRKGFQKVYDLTERVLPSEIDTSVPTVNEYNEHLIINTINSYGFASAKEITYLRYSDKKSFSKVLNNLLEEKKIRQIKISGINNDVYFTTEGNLKSKKESKNIHILSPFDNLIIQRKRLNNIFGYDYQVEFYLPAAKRKFGYFCMPVLYGNDFIGKIDAKANRQTGIFEVINYFPEKEKITKPIVKEALEEKLSSLADFTGCKSLNRNSLIL